MFHKFALRSWGDNVPQHIWINLSAITAVESSPSGTPYNTRIMYGQAECSHVMETAEDILPILLGAQFEPVSEIAAMLDMDISSAVFQGEDGFGA